MSELNEQLLPCPFCGSDDVSLHGSMHYGAIACDYCGTTGPAGDHSARPDEYWNRRATPAPQAAPSEHIAALRAFLKRCSNGGMSPEHVKIVGDTIDAAEQCGYFKAPAPAATQAAPSEPVAWACPLSERGEELEHPDVMWEADCGWDEKFKPFPLYREPVATPAPAQQAEGDARDGRPRYLTMVFNMNQPQAAGARELLREAGWVRACWSDAMTERDEARAAIASATTSTEGTR